MNTLLGWISALSPKARVFLAIFVLLVFGLAIFSLWRFRLHSEVNNVDADAAAGARAAQVAALTRDQDGDGLKDWEEAIFRTDPHNADSDADGTPDGEEIKQSRDPLKPNTSTDQQQPDDFASVPTSFAAGDYAGPAPNITEQFSRSLLPDIMGPILAGKAPQSDDLMRKVNGLDFLQNPERIWIGAKQYAEADITASQKNDLAAIMQMFLSISKTIVNHAPAVSDNQTIIINFIQNPTSEETRSSLLAYQNGMNALIQDVRKIPVPQDYKSFILSYLNTLSKMHHSLVLIANLENDPISALLAVKALPQAQEDFSMVVAKAQDESKKIVERKIKELTNAPQKLP